MNRLILIPVAAVVAVALDTAPLPAQDAPNLDGVRQAAEQGDADAQFYLGMVYYTGEGVSEDDAEAVRWYRMAAEQGDVSAQFSLGLMYATGRGVSEDDAEAVRWLRMAAEQGGFVRWADRHR